MPDSSAFSDRALQIIADDKIRAAMAAGEFDNLPDFGKPLELLSEPYDPYWWIRRKMKREQITPSGKSARNV